MKLPQQPVLWSGRVAFRPHIFAFLRIVRGLGLFLAPVIALSGCVWHSGHADHLVGPMLMRTNRTVGSAGNIVQTVHFPLLFEGGRQWGLSVGFVQRLAVAPALTDRPAGAKSGPWSAVMLHRAVTRAPEKAEFLRRVTLGGYAQLGAELRAFGLGLSARNDTLPRLDGFYELHFDSARPLNTAFSMQPVAGTNLSTTDQNKNQKGTKQP